MIDGSVYFIETGHCFKYILLVFQLLSLHEIPQLIALYAQFNSVEMEFRDGEDDRSSNLLSDSCSSPHAVATKQRDDKTGKVSVSDQPFFCCCL